MKKPRSGGKTAVASLLNDLLAKQSFRSIISQPYPNPNPNLRPNPNPNPNSNPNPKP